MAPSPPLDSVELVLIVTESVLYGIFLVLLLSALEALYEKRRLGHPYTLLLSVSILLFCTITAHLFFDVARIFDAFIYLPQNTSHSTGASSATEYFEDLANVKYIAVSAFYVVTTAVGDGFMIYRLYIVWNSKWWITILPFITWIPMCISGVFILWLVSHRPNGSIFNTEGGWITAWFALTMVTNLTCTLLISYRVWLSKRNVTRLGGRHYSSIQRVINALIQSAALYTLCLILSLALYVRQNNIQYVFAAINCPVVGIVFTMIAARSGTHRGTESDHESHSLRDMRPVAISITREINTDLAGNRDMNTKSLPFEDLNPSLDGADRFVGDRISTQYRSHKDSL